MFIVFLPVQFNNNWVFSKLYHQYIIQKKQNLFFFSKLPKTKAVCYIIIEWLNFNTVTVLKTSKRNKKKDKERKLNDDKKKKVQKYNGNHRSPFFLFKNGKQFLDQ